MPQAELGLADHLDVAERLLTLAEGEHAKSGDLQAWSIVLAFYSAVHWVRAYIRFKEPEAQLASHEDVRQYFVKFPELRKVKINYDTLKQSSQAVRYYGQFNWPSADYARTLQAAKQVKGWALPKCKAG